MRTMVVLVCSLMLSVLETILISMVSSNHKNHVFCAEPTALSIGMTEIVSVMELPIHNPIVSVHKCDDDARCDADDAQLHKNSGDEGANTIRHKHNEGDDGHFYDIDDDDKEEDDNDHNDADNDGHVNDDDDNVKFFQKPIKILRFGRSEIEKA